MKGLITTGKPVRALHMPNSKLPEMKKESPELATVHSQVLQDVLRRLDTAFRNFFEGRTKYPRTKSYVSSIIYPQAKQNWIYKNGITKIGMMVKRRARQKRSR